MTTHSNDGLSSNVVDLKGIHVLNKTLADGSIATYYRHRATGEKLTGLPGSETFETKRAELDKQVGKKKTESATLAGLIDAWQASPEYKKAAKSQSHHTNNNRVFKLIKAARVTGDNNKLLPAFGEMPIDALQGDCFFKAIMQYRTNLANEREAAGQSLREVDAQMTALCALFAWALKKRILKGAHPIGQYEKLYSSERNDVIFLDDQIEAWLRKAGQDNYKGRDLQCAFLLALTLGQRASDLRELLWGDYVVMAGRRGFAVWPLKTRDGEGNRKVFVPVLPWVGDILDGMRGQPDEKVLTLRGKPWAQRTLSYYFGNITRALGLVARVESKNAKGKRVFKEFELHMHDLRGTAITKLAEVGCSDRQIASITGHSVEHVSRILDKYVANTVQIAVGAIDALAASPSMIRLEQAVAHLQPAAPLPMITHQPELGAQLIELQAAE